MIQLRYRPAPHWPRLAWLATMRAGSDEVTVTHGSGVETRPEWFCEAVWTGAFDAGDFDRTDVVFGSGGRVRSDTPGVLFVASGSPLDRLHSQAVEGGWCCSNSLPCLLAATGSRLDRTDPRWFARVGSIVRGIDDFEHDLPTSDEPVRLTYFRNLRWHGSGFEEVTKPDPVPDGFTDFARYRDVLVASLAALAANGSDGSRRRTYRLMGTMSGGYDSSAVASLGRRSGALTEAFALSTGRQGRPDSGAVPAEHLGITLTTLERERWRDGDEMPEVPFLAADAMGTDVFLRAADHLLAGRVVLTGTYGDLAWGLHPPAATPDLQRGDRSGISVSEHRLDIGYLHCPVPFIGVRHAADIAAISRSAEMAPWDVGGDYSRPVPRRLLEEAGVPRGSFAVTKQAGAVLLHVQRGQLTGATEAELRRWCARHTWEFLAARRVPPLWTATLTRPTDWAARRMAPVLDALGRRLPGRAGAKARGAGRRARALGEQDRLLRAAFPWAVEVCSGRYLPVP